MSYQWFYYCPLDQVGEYLAKGWTIANDNADCHHGRHAVLMIWAGEGEPK